MKQILLHTGCDSITGNDAITFNQTATGSLLAAIIRGCIALNDTSVPFYVDIVEPTKSTSEPDSGAVLYIVAVLVFYSAGIVTMIVKYLKREKRELEEEKALEDFFRSMPAYRKEREQKNVNKMAIHAFHALTSFSYDDDYEDSVTSETEDNDNTRMCHETIPEVVNDDHNHAVERTCHEAEVTCQDTSVACRDMGKMETEVDLDLEEVSVFTDYEESENAEFQLNGPTNV